jgi:hypothetical protein
MRLEWKMTIFKTNKKRKKNGKWKPNATRLDMMMMMKWKSTMSRTKLIRKIVRQKQY